MLEAAKKQGGLSLFAINMKSLSVHRLRNHRSAPHRWWSGCGQNNHTKVKLIALANAKVLVRGDDVERVRFCRTCNRLALRGLQTEHPEMERRP